MHKEDVKTHALSIALHGALALALGTLVPAARHALRNEEAVVIDIVHAPAEPAPPPTPASEAPIRPVPTPAEPPARRPSERARMAVVPQPRPFSEAPPGPREAPPDVEALAAPTTPLPAIPMESTVGAQGATEYTTTASTDGTMGVLGGAGGGRGGTGAGSGGAGPLAQQETAQVAVSRDWEVTRMPVPMNDRDFEPNYPRLALRELRDGTVVVRLVIDADGRVASAEVVEPAGHGFDEAAVDYARKLRFDPARAGMRKVSSRIDWSVVFHARD